MTRLDRLQAAQKTIKSSITLNAIDQPRVIYQDSENGSTHQSTEGQLLSNRARNSSFDKHFIVGAGDQFYGSSSVFALMVEVMAHALEKFQDLTFVPMTNQVDSTDSEESLEFLSPGPSRETVEKLVQLYMSSTNILYDFVDETELSADIDGYFKVCDKVGGQITEKEAHQYFRISMICAAASANKARHHHEYYAESLRFYREASRYVEEVTSEVSAESLQALLLLCVFCLFHPRKGDIWKLLDYACRLSVELGYHTEQAAELESDGQSRRRRGIFWGLYTIERIVGQLFGRPSDLPEEIITTEYPWAVSGAIMADQISLQSISIAHQYRLVYLRSEIYRELYAPAEPPDPPLDWYKSKFVSLLEWRRELEVDANRTGVGSLTADLGYHCTIAFLFQPLMLQALANTRTSTFTNDRGRKIPSDNYWSSCEIIRIYDRMLRASEDSQPGTFPMTFMSAHYIFVAAMTILAHCLLVLDGRVSTIGPIEENSTESRVINFSNIFEISSCSMVVLAWCADRWPGMAGMLDTYRKLSNRLLPALTRCGFVG